MDTRRTVLVCDNDYLFLNNMETQLADEGFDVDTIDNAADLIPTALRIRPHVILVNPEMKAFNELDVCNHIIKEQRVEVILLLDKNSTYRAQVGDCVVEDVVIKPVEISQLVHLLTKHISVNP